MSMSQWHKVGIELPPNWKEAVADRARELGCPMRYLWMAAIDRLLALPTPELEQMALAFELIARKDFEKLTKMGPGQCQELIVKWAADFVASLGGEGGKRSSATGGRRSS
jgi:hypothetical protein